jgi:hypothetical protein
MSVAGRRMTSELRQSKNRDSITSQSRSNRRARRGRTLDDHRQLAAKKENLRNEREVPTVQRYC